MESTGAKLLWLTAERFRWTMTVYEIPQQNLRGTAERLSKVNPVLRKSQLCHEYDTNKFKMGDGVTSYNDLPYFIDEEAISTLIETTLALYPPGSDPRIGDIATLTTESKETVVDAINELNMPDVSLVLIYNNAKAG
jgi:hypothetical protein